MRGRHSAAFLTMMGIGETIAADLDDYIALATRLAAEGVMRPHISHRFPMDRVADAYRVLIDRQVIGKVVIEIA